MTLPDRVADPTSLDYSIRWYKRIGRMYVDASHPEIDRPLPWFLVLQNGMRPREVAAVLRSYPFEGLFLGGDDAFKTTAPGWSALAHDLGKRFHFGRVSRIPWLELACEVDADSADTTQFLWTDDLFYKLVGAWETLPQRCK